MGLLAFFDKVIAAVDEGKSFDAVFLDFAKAFDKVPRERLLKKVKARAGHNSANYSALNLAR
jgi:hypothetical protein